ncbi:MAG: PilZ domain-containing protein [Lawsonibacter sp.]|nr:PilZ domain-containing protein [Lawsonibacter sp.]
MIPFLYCRKAELRGADGKESIPASVSIGAMDSLLVTLPRDYKHNSSQPVQITFFDPIEGLVTCRCLLTSPLVADDHRYRCFRCQVLEYLSRNQRREDIKISLTAKVTVTQELPDRTLEAPATLYNISAGGVYLVTDLKLKPGDQVSFYFHEAGGTIPLTAEVLRVETRPDRYSRPVVGYGCRFVDMASMYELQLRSYVFKEERRVHSNK